MPGFAPARSGLVTSQAVVYLMGLLTQAEQDAVIEKVRRVAGVKRVVPVVETVTAVAQPAASTSPSDRPSCQAYQSPISVIGIHPPKWYPKANASDDGSATP